MTTISILLVGSFVVPLAVILVFSVLYFLRYKKYLIDKNSYKDGLFLSDCWKGYIFARLADEECRTGFKIWWYCFGSKYIDLMNYHSERCIYELDQLDRFEESSDNRPSFNRKSFMRHWKEIHAMLFDNGSYNDAYSSKGYSYMFNPRFGKDPFGWMTIMIESKLFELYKKHTLQILRTKGYKEFCKFLASSHDKSQMYPHNAAFSIIASGKFYEKIIWDNSQEIGERIKHELKVILGSNKTPKTESQVEQLESLMETFALRGSLAGGGFQGRYCVGISEVREEICDLLNKVKVLT